MKGIVDFFVKKGVLFKSFQEIDKTLLKTRKKIFIYAGTDTKKNYHSIFHLNQKSRFLMKNSIDLVDLEEKLQNLKKHNFKYKHLIISKNICSKAHGYLTQKGWKIHHDFV